MPVDYQPNEDAKRENPMSGRSEEGVSGLFRAWAEAWDGWVGLMDGHGVVVWANTAFVEALGSDPAGRPAKEALGVFQGALAAAGEPAGIEPARTEWACPDSPRVYAVTLTNAPVDADGRGRLLCLRDLTASKNRDREYQRRDAVLRTASFAAAELMNPKDRHAGVRRVLEEIARVLGAGRGYLYENIVDRDGRRRSCLRHEWVASGVASQLYNPDLREVSLEDYGFRRWADALAAGESVVGRVVDFPESERAVLDPRGVRSVVVLPIAVDGQWWGFIGFEHYRETDLLTAFEADALRTATVLLANALRRWKLEEDARASRRMLSLVMDSIPQYIFWKDTQGVYRGCNRKFAEGAGLSSPDAVVGKTDYDLSASDEQAEAFRLWDRRVMERNEPELHIREKKVMRDGSVRLLDTCKLPLLDEQGRVVGILGTYEDVTDPAACEGQRTSET